MSRHFFATPKIEIFALLSEEERDELRQTCGGSLPAIAHGVYLLDVDVAERAVAWLKDHGVEQKSPEPERDTAKAIGQCRRCGEKDSRRKNGRCMGVPGSTHDWPECPSEYERCAKATAVGAARGTCKNNGNDCGAHEFRGVLG